MNKTLYTQFVKNFPSSFNYQSAERQPQTEDKSNDQSILQRLKKGSSASNSKAEIVLKRHQVKFLN